MLSAVWSLVLLVCLCGPARSDTLSCGLRPQQQAFNTLVCLLGCEGQVPPSLSWELCRQAVESQQFPSPPDRGAVSRRAEEEAQYSAVALERYQQDGDQEEPAEPRTSHYDSSPPGSTEEGEGLEEEGGEEGEEDIPVELSKRFGGFLKGRHGYRKLIGPGRALQKRYGGFIGVRKSARRKWNKQKRVDQLLRQYLGARTRGRYTLPNLPMGRRQSTL